MSGAGLLGLPDTWPVAWRWCLATAAGALVAAGLQRWLGEPAERSAHAPADPVPPGADTPPGLLTALGAEARFEIDGQGVVQLLQALPSAPPGWPELPVGPGPGPLLWALPGLQLSPASLATVRTALDHQRDFAGVVLSWTASGQRLRHVSASAVAQRDAQGHYLGHAGVLASLSGEARFHDLFRRIPTALVVHRQGQVLDANPAAVALFGQPDLHSLLQADLLALHAPGDWQARTLAHWQGLEALATGAALPACELQLCGHGERAVIVQVSSVRVETDDGAATLSIYQDDTERHHADQALQRSEALLSHLVASSPDVITLTELATGRYAMVNPSFTRLTGFDAAEAIGKTSLELNIWTSQSERAELVEKLRQQATVQNIPAVFNARDGSAMPMLMSAARFSMDGRAYLVISARDISASEQARLEREAILANAVMGIAVTRERRFTLANPRFEQMFGWPADTLAGQSGQVIWPSLDDYAELGRLVGPRLGAGEPVDVERTVVRRDGSTFLCRFLAKALDPRHPAQGGTIWLAEDVTERRQVEQALATARDEAEAANRAKSAFLASTSHEIRTPLNALLGLAHLARQPEVDPAHRQRYIEQISDSAQTLSAILTDILDLSKIEAGKMHLDQLAFDLHDLLANLQQAYGTLADAKGLRFQLQQDDDLPQIVLGDPVRLRQILSNFLFNALKFTEQGQVLLSARRGLGHALRFEVTDTGPGIDEGLQARLFSPFVQGDSSITRRVGGSGLGLSICRQLAELMQGGVGVVSVRGQGSCFWAEVPLPAGEADDLDSGSSGYGTDVLMGARVLMVEDNGVNMMIAVAMLEQWGLDVAQATGGQQAIDAVHQAFTTGRPFDLVLMDVQMPDMSGHEATAVLRMHFTAEELPIVALTAAALVSERNEALAAGMNDFLTKPIDGQRLRHTLVKLLRRKYDA